MTMSNEYHSYPVVFIGESDYASLIMAGPSDKPEICQELHFGMDGEYSAHLVDERAEFGDHYKLEAEFHSWLKIYDDEGLVKEFQGEKIKVYRAGEMGCLIQIFGTRENN